jgi:hypothetical protein
MARSLSGTLGTSLAYVVSRVSALVTVSLLPFLLLAASMVAYFLNVETRIAELDPGDMDAIMRSMAGDTLFAIACLLLFMWLAVKVHRLYLAGEAPTLIGSAGTIKAAFFMTVFYVGVLFLSYLPLVLAALVLGLGLAFVHVALLIAGVVLIMLIAIWLVLRLVVGYAPIALGEVPGFFSGWALTRDQHVGLFLGVLGLSLLIALVSVIVLGCIVAIGYLIYDSILAVVSVSVLVTIGAVFYAAFAIVMYWPLFIYMAEAYVRLSGRERPLPIS